MIRKFVLAKSPYISVADRAWKAGAENRLGESVKRNVRGAYEFIRNKQAAIQRARMKG